MVGLLTVCTLDVAQAEGKRRVVLVQPDAQLSRSVVIALSAWDIEVVSVEGPSPGASLPAAERNAADVARQAHADAVAWVSESDAGAVLWIYDVESNHVGSRVLTDRLPFDEPTAAAAALSVKALLRSSSVAPPRERYGATESTAPPPSMLWVEAEAGERFIPRAVSEARAALGLAFWPRGVDEHVGFGLGASVGLGAPVTTSSPTQLDARFNDVALSSSVRTRMHLGRRFVLEPALGGSVHFTSLDGTAGTDDVHVLARRVDGSVDATVSLDARFGAVGIGACASIEYVPRYQRYLVYGDEVLSLMPLVVAVALRISAGIF